MSLELTDQAVFPIRLGSDPSVLRAASGTLQRLLEVTDAPKAIAVWAELVAPHRSQILNDLATNPDGAALPIRLHSSGRILIRFSRESDQDPIIACALPIPADPRPSSHDPLRFAASRFAHDLNNLLMALQGNAELGLMQTDKASAASTCFREIQAACRRAKESTDDLLTYAGKGRCKLIQEDIRLLLEHLRKGLLHELPAGFELKLEMPLRLPLVPVDRDLMLRSLKALISNAVRAMGERPGPIIVQCRFGPHDFPEGAAVRLRDHQRPTEDWLMLDVIDTGTGIAEHLIPRIFEPYFTTWPRTKGLGLPFVEGAMAQHRGMVLVQTQPSGTTVSLLIPACATQAPARTDSVQTGAEQKRILIVDDDLLVANAARETLVRAGFKTQLVQTAHAAREALASTAFAAVMLDIHLPDGNGVELAHEIRSKDPEQRILFCSGFLDPKNDQQIKAMPHARFLAKPYRTKELQDLVRELVAG